MIPDDLAHHTVLAFDEDIARIRNLIRACGSLASGQIVDAVDAMTRRDIVAAGRIEAIDAQIDALQAAIELEALTTISRRSPQADDLRELFSVIKIAGDLERVGDYAKNIAKRTVAIARTSTGEPEAEIFAIAVMVASMIDDAIKAYSDRDADLARNVIERDSAVDEAYNALFQSQLAHITGSAERAAHGAHLLFVAKNLERVGDHATNIAELTYFSVTGSSIGPRKNTATVYEPIDGHIGDMDA